MGFHENSFANEHSIRLVLQSVVLTFLILYRLIGVPLVHADNLNYSLLKLHGTIR